ncbi:unnamed protein product [Urochloa humidicola]
MARPGAGHTAAWLLVSSAVLLLLAPAATAQDCLSATFSNGRTFGRCDTLPVLGASLHWTYHPENATADVAFRAPSGAGGWVAWGINTERPGAMPGSSVLVASQDGNGVVSVLMTYLESTAPTLTNNTLKYDVTAGPAAEYSGGAYTIFATIALPGNSTQQNTVWQAGPISSGGQISPHPRSGPNLQSTKRLDFFTGSPSPSPAGPAAPAPDASNSWLRRPDVSSPSSSFSVVFSLSAVVALLLICMILENDGQNPISYSYKYNGNIYHSLSISKARVKFSAFDM